MKILFLSRWYPYPPDNGARQRIFHLLHGLAGAHTVDLISFTDEPINDERRKAMLNVCRRVETAAYNSFQPGRARALRGYFSRQPRSFVDTYSAEMSACIAAAIKNEHFDAVVASEIDMAPYAREVPGVVRILEELEISQYEQRVREAASRLSSLRHQLTRIKLSVYLAELMRAFDACTVVSDREREVVRRMIPGIRNLWVVPNGVDVGRAPSSQPTLREDTLIYSGALTYQANYDAVDYFLSEIYPLILKERPQVQFRVTGSLEGVDLAKLPGRPGVIFTGYLKDIVAEVASSWLSVVPLRAGGGTRLKVLESLHLGTPVVSTTKGVEGLELSPGRDLLVADTAEDFADAALSILANPHLRETLARQGRQTVREHYDWKSISQRLTEIIEDTVQARAFPDSGYGISLPVNHG